MEQVATVEEEGEHSIDMDELESMSNESMTPCMSLEVSDCSVMPRLQILKLMAVNLSYEYDIYRSFSYVAYVFINPLLVLVGCIGYVLLFVQVCRTNFVMIVVNRADSQQAQSVPRPSAHARAGAGRLGCPVDVLRAVLGQCQFGHLSGGALLRPIRIRRLRVLYAWQLRRHGHTVADGRRQRRTVHSHNGLFYSSGTWLCRIRCRSTCGRVDCRWDGCVCSSACSRPSSICPCSSPSTHLTAVCASTTASGRCRSASARSPTISCIVLVGVIH